MRLRISPGLARKLIIGVMLLAFAGRALVPPGFMPASGRLSVEICPEGFPAQLLSHAGHHHHAATHWHGEHCVFGGACASGPVSQSPHLAHLAPTELAPPRGCGAAALVVHLVYLPHARGPPAA